MITFNSVKNTSLEDIIFPVHSVVLLKYSERETKNGINTTIKYVAIDGLKKNNPVTVVKTLLTALLSEYKAAKEFNNKFKIIKDEKGNVILENSNIQVKRTIFPFLSGNIIFRSNSQGKLFIALKCDKDIFLADTILNIKKEHTITKVDGEELKVVIYHHSKQIIAQSADFTTFLSYLGKPKQVEMQKTQLDVQENILNDFKEKKIYDTICRRRYERPDNDIKSFTKEKKAFTKVDHQIVGRLNEDIESFVKRNFTPNSILLYKKGIIFNHENFNKITGYIEIFTLLNDENSTLKYLNEFFYYFVNKCKNLHDIDIFHSFLQSSILCIINSEGKIDKVLVFQNLVFIDVMQTVNKCRNVRSEIKREIIHKKTSLLCESCHCFSVAEEPQTLYVLDNKYNNQIIEKVINEGNSKNTHKKQRLIL
jgi:hypothetical protein